ncbi:ATP-binding cassette domain-containing protein [Clostridium sp.]|uniref:ATP-binding cassette domain-containing protein n=1 Tax=Clostridium sp. TaxID=1506 RepID=UPI0034646773
MVNLLQKVHLDPSIYMNKYPKEHSGGERQRVAIARSISTKPSFLVLDEQTSMIDACAKSGVLNLLEELKTNEKIYIVMISHDISTVINNCDRIAVMKHGEIIECATIKDIKENPCNEYTRELI